MDMQIAGQAASVCGGSRGMEREGPRLWRPRRSSELIDPAVLDH